MKSAFLKIAIIPTDLLYDVELKYYTIRGNWLVARDFLNRPFDVAITVDPLVPVDFYMEDDISYVKVRYDTPDFSGKTECFCNTRSKLTPLYFNREIPYEI